jgi:hypothetical protein
MRLWVRRRWSRRSIAADYSMPHPFGKPCAAALDSPRVTVDEGGILEAEAVVLKDVKPWMIVIENTARD